MTRVWNNAPDEFTIAELDRLCFPKNSGKKKEESWTGVWNGKLTMGPDGNEWDGSWSGVMKTKHGSSKRRWEDDDED